MGHYMTHCSIILLDFLKGYFNLEKGDHVFILHRSAGKYVSLKYPGHKSWKNYKYLTKHIEKIYHV